MRKKIDRPFFISLVVLVIGGLLIFASASLGLLAKDTVQYSSIAFNQLFFGIFIGSILCFVGSISDYKKLRVYSFYLFLFAIVLNVLVLVPGIGVAHGGAQRWLTVASYSFQPSELLRLACIFYYATLAASFKDKINTFKFGLLPLLLVMSIGVGILLLQTDTDLILPITLTSMYFVAGGRSKDLAILGLIGIIGLTGLVMAKPYLQARIMTFINPASDPLTSGYQIQQSLIAIGSGQLTGRGFGQSIQKFNYLPEPIGDSIFAVAAEEFGFIGSIVIIIAYLVFTIRGFKIATHIPDLFGRLLTVGIVILICAQSFMNIGAMLGVIPLTGVPLVFISHGGTSLLLSLCAIGIVLNISRHQTRV